MSDSGFRRDTLGPGSRTGSSTLSVHKHKVAEAFSEKRPEYNGVLFISASSQGVLVAATGTTDINLC